MNYSERLAVHEAAHAFVAAFYDHEITDFTLDLVNGCGNVETEIEGNDMHLLFIALAGMAADKLTLQEREDEDPSPGPEQDFRNAVEYVVSSGYACFFDNPVEALSAALAEVTDILTESWDVVLKVADLMVSDREGALTLLNSNYHKTAA